MNSDNQKSQTKQTAQHTETVPKSWPNKFFGSFDIYKYSKPAVMTNIGTLILLYLGLIVLTFVFNLLIKNIQVKNTVDNIISIIFAPAFTLVLLKGIDREKIEVTDSLKKALPLVLQYFLLSLLVGFALLGSLLLFIIPFFFVLPRLMLAPYYVVDKKLNCIDAFKASWDETKGHSGKVWGIISAYFVVSLLTLTIIGIPFVIYFWVMYSAAFAILYRYVVNQPKKVEAPRSAVAPAT